MKREFLQNRQFMICDVRTPFAYNETDSSRSFLKFSGKTDAGHRNTDYVNTTEKYGICLEQESKEVM